MSSSVIGGSHEVGGGSMTNESDPDVKAAELRAVDATHHAAPRPGSPRDESSS